MSDEPLTLAALAAASADIAATRSRRAKIDRIAELLSQADADDLALAALYLSGTTRQGRIGVGWATLADLDAVDDSRSAGGAAPKPEPVSASVTLREVDGLLDRARSHHRVGLGRQAPRPARSAVCRALGR